MDMEFEYEDEVEDFDFEDEEEDFDFEDEEEVIDFKDEDEDFQELEELTPPKVSSWIGINGKKVHGVMVINNVVDNPESTSEFDSCPICYRAWTSQGNHRICCLPCGHMYGLSCIKKWLLQSSSCEKCPQCNKLCSYKDVILLYGSSPCVTPQHKESSARYFPFTKHGYNAFKLNEQCRRLDAHKLYPDAKKRKSHVCRQLQIVVNQHTKLMSQWKDVTQQLEELKQQAQELGQPVDEVGQPDALQRQADALKRQANELKQHGDALEERDLALKQRFDALGERISQYQPRLKFFEKMYKEHKLKNQKTKPASTCHKN